MSRSPVALVQGRSSAASLLKPVRLQILDRLQNPDSASGVAASLGLPRQRVGYHVRELEKDGFLRHVEDRRKGNCLERVLQASARQYVIAPNALGPLAAQPEEIRDRFSSDYLIAAAARTVQDVGTLQEEARKAGKRLATMTLETEITFASPADRNSYAKELAEAVARLARKYHRPDASRGRSFRFTVEGYPAAPSNEDKAYVAATVV
jgi:DNA-binding transcriptional ArsR family regulator